MTSRARFCHRPAGPPQIRLAFDGVCNNLEVAWCAWAARRYGRPVDSRQWARWGYLPDIFGPGAFDFFAEGAYRHHVEVRPGAAAFIRELEARYGAVAVAIVTAPPPQGVPLDKDEFIIERLGVPAERIIHALHKPPHCVGAILVDDFLQNVLTHIAANAMPGISFRHDCPFTDPLAYPGGPEAISAGHLHQAEGFDAVLALLETLAPPIAA